MFLDIGNGVTINRERQLLDLDRVEYEESLYLFLRAAWKQIDSSPWVDGWPIEAIAEHLQGVIDGDIKRLLINLPPRFGKSSVTSVALPAWAWAQPQRSPTSGPGVQFLHASYAQSLSLRDSVKCRRLIQSPWYQSMWGDRFVLSGDQNVKSRFSNDQGGERLITSIGAGVTGEGGSCFPAGTLVSTPRGDVPIEQLVIGSEVLAFDHSQGTVVKSRIAASRERRSSDLYELRAFSGHRFVCTGDHQVFSPGRGYIRADRMGPGDGVLLRGGGSDGSASPGGQPPVRSLQYASSQTAVRSAQGPETKQSGCLLQRGLFARAPRGEKHKALQGLWRAQKASSFGLLFGRVSDDRPRGEAQEALMSALREILWDGAERLAEILLFGVRGRRPFRAYGRSGQFQLQAAGQVLEPVYANAPDRDRARRVSMCDLWGGRAKGALSNDAEVEPTRAPYRRKHPEQRARKSDHALPPMPCEASCWGIGSVATVAPLGCGEVSVYDIQVEGRSNFFANGILVHNCIIIDDPNAANEAFSEATIQSTIDWWDGTMSTRLNDMKTGAYIVIQQRLAEDDLTGHILSKDVGDWTHLVLPMRYEPDRSFATPIGWKDPRTEPGELLWPARFGEAEVDLLERQLGPFSAAGQLQQRPEPAGGGVIKREWWQLWEDTAFPPMDYILASLDTAYTEKTVNDFSAMTVWGVFSSDTVAHANRVLDANGRPMYQDRSYQEGAPKVMLMNAWQARLELHELVEKVAATAKKLKCDKLIIENKAAGISVAQEIRRLYGNEDFAVQLFDPKSQDKLSRLYSVQHLFAEGMVYAPDRAWADMTITQVGQFPKGKHDDIVDTCSQALRHMRELGLLTRSAERIAEVEQMKQYTGKPPAPLYPA